MPRLLDLLVISIVYVGVNGDVQFNCSSDLYCLSASVEYQCIVTGSALMRWRIRDGMTSLGTVTYDNGADLVIAPVPFANSLPFFTDLSATSPSLISNISFTVQSSINGYTLRCEDVEMNTEDCEIIIVGIPASPQNLNILTDTFTSSSVSISWTRPTMNDSCITGYRYNVSSTDITIVQSTSDPAVTTVTVEGLVPSDDEYCVVVTAIDTANRYSSDSNTTCLIFNVPPAVADLDVANDTESNTTIEVYVEWEEYKGFNVDSSVAVPDFLGFRVSIFNTTDPNDFSKDSMLLPPSATNHTFTGVPLGRTYNVTVTAINGVGSSVAFFMFDAPGPFVDITTATSSVMSLTITSSMSTSASVSSTTSTRTSTTTTTTTSTTATRTSTTQDPTVPPSRTPSSGSSSTAAIAGGVAGGIILLLLVIVIVLVIIVYCLFVKKKDEKSAEFLGKDNNEVIVQSIQMKDKDPEIGESLYNDKTDKGVAPPTDAPPTETPTYQDPSTIKREEAPTGDLYALPEKKRTVEDKPQASSVYAELDLPNKSSPSNGNPNTEPAVVQGSKPESVVYADIRAQAV